MRLIRFSFLIIPTLCFSNDYNKGVEQAKTEIIVNIENNINRIYFSFKDSHSDDEYYNLRGQLDIYHQLKIHLYNEFDKPHWKQPIVFTY